MRKYRDMFRGSDKVVFLSPRYTEDALQLAGPRKGPGCTPFPTC